MSKMIIIDRSKKFSEFFDKEPGIRKIDFLVLHHVEARDVQHAIEQFKEHKVSSHFLIDESGKVFELVDENNIAYHAGVSNWKGFEGLNKNSIGIEFINSSPFNKKFEKVQMRAGLELCRYLIFKYNIKKENVLGHSDIAYVKETGFLDRKQDPSHLFDWKFLAQNGVGVFAEKASISENLKDISIKKTKEKLREFGYKVVNLNDEFDEEMQAIARVFNRRFLGIDSEEWSANSEAVLNEILKAN